MLAINTQKREQRKKRKEAQENDASDAPHDAEKNVIDKERATMGSQSMVASSEKKAESVTQTICTEECDTGKQQNEAVKKEQQTPVAMVRQFASFFWGTRQPMKRPLVSLESSQVAYRVVAYANEKRRRIDR